MESIRKKETSLKHRSAIFHNLQGGFTLSDLLSVTVEWFFHAHFVPSIHFHSSNVQTEWEVYHIGTPRLHIYKHNLPLSSLRCFCQYNCVVLVRFVWFPTCMSSISANSLAVRDDCEPPSTITTFVTRSVGSMVRFFALATAFCVCFG